MEMHENEMMDLAMTLLVCRRTRSFCMRRPDRPAWTYQREDDIMGQAQDMLGYCTWGAS